MAAKAAPVATLPRAGGAQQSCTLLPSSTGDSSEAQTLESSGRGGEMEGEGRLPAGKGLPGWGEGRHYWKGTLRVPTPTNMSSVLLRSRHPGGEMLMGR